MKNHHRLLGLVTLTLYLGLCSERSSAASGMWNLNPADGDWNRAANWSPVTVPNGPSDIATFGLSNTSSVFLSAMTELNGILFNPGASAYTIAAHSSFTLTFSGAGIVNNSGVTQNFIAPVSGLSGSGTLNRITFTNNASAGDGTIFTIDGGDAEGINGGRIAFENNATASTATMIANGSSHPAASGGSLNFAGTSTASAATLIANGGINGGQGGRISFVGDSNGGTARVQVFGNGSLSLGGSMLPSVTIGSLEGNGFVGGFQNAGLTVGSNNLSTTFSGTISGGGMFVFSGGLTKIGTGTLTLSGANTYQGNTAVDGGQLTINGSIISASIVNSGTLGGSGAVAAVTVNSGGTLSPGDNIGILGVAGNLVLNLGAIYLVDLNGTALGAQYDQSDVTGAVSLGNATLSLRLGFAPSAGDQFVIIQNDGADAVTGTFQGLSEGALLTSAGQTFAITYQGGDGNDVVLTAVVPEPATWLLLSAAAFLWCARAALAAAARTRPVGN